MFCDVWKWAGKLRQEDLSIGVPWREVEGRLYILMNDLPVWKETETPLIEQAARLHHKAVFIHPFPNGNGRWARMMANIFLRLEEQPFIRWPEKNLGKVSSIRAEYIEALKRADEGDEDSFIELHRRYQERLAPPSGGRPW
jgi:fido (protein-threonine AMPylation protein)